LEYRPSRTRTQSRPSYVIPDSDEDEKRLKRRDKKVSDQNHQRHPRNEARDDVSTNTRNTRNSGGRDSLLSVGSTGKLKNCHPHEDDEIVDSHRSEKKLKQRSKSPPPPDPPSPRKFRNRDLHQRTQLNVSHLGGNGKSYNTVSESESEESDALATTNVEDDQIEDENGDVQEQEGEENDEEEEEEEEEEDEDEFPTKKYSFRDRTMHRRETLNVTHLGGDGQSYLKKGSKPHSMSTLPSPYTTPRLYTGGKIPVNNRNERRPHPSYKRVRHATRNHFDSSSESSSDSSRGRDRKRYRGHHEGNSHDEESHFREHEQDRLRAEMASIVPLSLGQSGTNAMNGLGGSVKDKVSKRDISRADVTPIAIDSSIGFSSVGGLDNHVRALKEMVVLPLLYPDVFQRFETQPPRGVLFVGPPGTGKTLTARALANSLSTAGGPASGSIGGRKVSFFMRKGADCLSKWVGEGERQLRLLFEQVRLPIN
jgi:ATP-dependent 26S proteasome regulatory subunit